MIKKRYILIPLLVLMVGVVVIGIFGYILFSRTASETEVVFAATEVGTPQGGKVTKDIGPAGGTLSSQDGRLTLTVPLNALTETLPFSIQPITNKAAGGLGLAYRLGPDGMTFTTPLQLSARYDDHDLEGTVPEALTLAYQDAKGAWHGQKIVKLDQAEKTFTISTTHFTDEAAVPGIRMLPAQATVYVGEDQFIALVMMQCKKPGFWDKLLSRPLDCSPTNIQVNRDWKLDGPGKIQFATKAAPPTFSNPINGQLYTAPPTKPSPNVALVKVTTNAQMWNPDTGEMFDGPRTFATIITIVDRGYRATGTEGDIVFSGRICSLEEPFTISGSPMNSKINFKPSSPTEGTYTTTQSGYEVVARSGGTYQIVGADTDKPRIVFTGSGSATGPPGTVTTSGMGYGIDLVPLTGNECGGNK